MSLFNIFSIKFDDYCHSSFDKEDIINCSQNRNAMSLQLLAIEKNRFAGHFQVEERIESIKRHTSNVNFFYQGIIKYN